MWDCLAEYEAERDDVLGAVDQGFAHLGYGPGSLPVTERLADQVFSLPMYASLSEGLQDKAISAVREVLSTVQIPAITTITNHE